MVGSSAACVCVEEWMRACIEAGAFTFSPWDSCAILEHCSGLTNARLMCFLLSYIFVCCWICLGGACFVSAIIVGCTQTITDLWIYSKLECNNSKGMPQEMTLYTMCMHKKVPLNSRV